jgi:cytochrome c556
MVVIATNTLLTPPYQHEPQAEWVKWAKTTADIAMEGKTAAEAKDIKAIEEIGGRLDVACDSCHEKFRAAE